MRIGEQSVFILVEKSYVDCYPTAAQAEMDMEVVDVREGLFEAFDGAGRRYEIKASNSSGRTLEEIVKISTEGQEDPAAKIRFRAGLISSLENRKGSLPSLEGLEVAELASLLWKKEQDFRKAKREKAAAARKAVVPVLLILALALYLIFGADGQ